MAGKDIKFIMRSIKRKSKGEAKEEAEAERKRIAESDATFARRYLDNSGNPRAEFRRENLYSNENSHSSTYEKQESSERNDDSSEEKDYSNEYDPIHGYKGSWIILNKDGREHTVPSNCPRCSSDKKPYNGREFYCGGCGYTFPNQYDGFC